MQLSKTFVAGLIALTCVGGAQAAPNRDPKAAPSGAYAVDTRHASLTGKISHLGLADFSFRFASFQARYDYDATKPAASKIEVLIDPKSVQTGVAALDTELQGERFFNSAKFPQIRFVSTRVEPGADNAGSVIGDLTLLGVTKPATLQVRYNGSAVQGKDQKMGFSGTLTVKRSEFGMSALQGPIGDDVTLAIEAEFIRQP